MIYELDFSKLSVQFYTENNMIFFDSLVGDEESLSSPITRENVKQLAQMFREIEIYLEKSAEDIG